MKNKTKKFEPAEWQRDPETLKADRIVYWRHGVMMTAQMPLADAKRLVREGYCYALTDYMIEAFEDKEV